MVVVLTPLHRYSDSHSLTAQPLHHTSPHNSLQLIIVTKLPGKTKSVSFGFIHLLSYLVLKLNFSLNGSIVESQGCTVDCTFSRVQSGASTPCSGLQQKYSVLSTTPLCSPTGLTNSTPAQIPGWKCNVIVCKYCKFMIYLKVDTS